MSSAIQLYKDNTIANIITNADEHFLRHFLKIKSKRSSYTAIAYEHDIIEFFNKYIEDITLEDIRNINIFHVENYICMLQEKGLASSTIHRKISSLSSLYSWLLKYQDNKSNTFIIKFNPFAHMKDIKPTLSYEETEFLSKEETRKLLASINTNTLVGLRDKCMISLALNTAIRKSEIINIRIRDITTILGYNVIKVIRKRSKKDFVKINGFVQNLIVEYIEKTNRSFDNDKDDFLFKSHSLNPKQQKDKLNSATFNKILNKYCVDLNKHLKVHSLRHTAITIAIQNGATLDKVQSFAGHESANTTARYIHSLDKLHNNAGDLIDVF